MSHPAPKKIFFENLDGLRFLSFLVVFLYHSFFTSFAYLRDTPVYHFIKKDIFGNGNLGVNFFFVLSGFLITYLLLEEKKVTGKVHVPKFWLRRVLRIWPLYFFCVFFGFVIFPLLKNFMGGVSNETANPLFYLTFTSNFDILYNGLPDSSILGVLWSIAVEEQFYFIWPLLLAFIPGKYLWIPFSLLLAGSILFRYFMNNDLIHEYHSISCMGDLVVGAWGAWLIQQKPSMVNRVKKMPRLLILGIYLLFVTLFFLRDEMVYYWAWTRPFERCFIAVVILLILLEQCYAERSFIKLHTFRLMSKMGVITYGLYCLHFIGILITLTLTSKLKLNTHLWQVLVLETVLAFLLSLLIAGISYRFLEKPFLRLKDKFAFIVKH